MRERILRYVAAFLMPGGIVVSAVGLLLTSRLLESSYPALAGVVPWAMLAIGLYMGLRFRRSRIIWASLVLVLAERTLSHFVWGAAEQTQAARMLFDWVVLLVPINVGLIALLPEREVLHPRNLRAGGVLLAEVILVAVTSRAAWDLTGLLELRLLGGTLLEAVGLPGPAALAFLLCAVLLLARFAMVPGPAASGYFWALAAAWGSTALSEPGAAASLLFASGVAALAFSEAETSHVMAFQDELTGLPGRRALMDQLDGLTDIYVAVMVDVDRFKKFNDTYGHDVGDDVLRMVASRLQRAGGGGRAFRYGGEEFTLLYPGRLLEEVLPHLEALRETIEESGFNLRHQDRPDEVPEDRTKAPRSDEQVSVTVSMGAAQGNARSGEDPHEVLKAADEALYKAKRGGRNRVKSADNRTRGEGR